MQNDTVFSDIAIIHKTYNFYLCINITVAKIPKKDRFTIGNKCENITLEILEKLYEANSKYGQNRLLILRSIDTKLKILQALVKALFDIKAINDKRFFLLSEKLIEIGKCSAVGSKQPKVRIKKHKRSRLFCKTTPFIC